MLVRYPSPLPASKQYRLFVNGLPVDVYDTPVHFGTKPPLEELEHPFIASFAYFDTDEPAVSVRVETLGEPVSACEIAPKSRGMQGHIVAGALEFAMAAPDRIVLTINGDENTTLMLFANPLEEYQPDPADPDVLFFGPGIHHIQTEDLSIRLHSGQTLYIAGGAVVYGLLRVLDSTDVTVCGRGILHGGMMPCFGENTQRRMGLTPRNRECLCDFQRCQRVSFEGLLLVNTPSWTVRTVECDDVLIENLKLIGYGENSDGIDLCNSCNITCRDIFMRTSDDNFVIKGIGRGNSTHSALNIDISHSVLWCDKASALEIGHETCMCAIAHVRFSDIDILQQYEDTCGYHALDITTVDQANIYDIVYEDIRIEKCARFFGARVQTSQWATDGRHGTIRDVTLRNISVDGNCDIDLFGWDDSHDIRDITFENLTMHGSKCTEMPKIRQNAFVHDLLLFADGELSDVLLDTYPENMQMQPVSLKPALNATGAASGSSLPALDSELWDGFDCSPVTQFGTSFQLEERDGKKAFLIPGERLGEKNPSIPLGCTASTLFLLMTAAGERISPLHATLATLRVQYADGSSITAPISYKADCDTWAIWSLADWQPILGEMRTYVVPFENPKPSQPIAAISLLDGNLPEIPVLLALSLL